ncbi:hypothetical protein ACWEOZ_37425 [Actinoplanes sp. NPDC004185]
MISVRSGTWNPLWADFYVNGTSQGESRTKTHINYTHTVFYNGSGNFIYSADSPNQYW